MRRASAHCQTPAGRAGRSCDTPGAAPDASTDASTAGSWDGVYSYARNRVREMNGGERTAKGLEVELEKGSTTTP